jgi:hypothetical protein
VKALLTIALLFAEGLADLDLGASCGDTVQYRLDLARRNLVVDPEPPAPDGGAALLAVNDALGFFGRLFAANKRLALMISPVRGCRDLKQRPGEFASDWHLAEYLNNVQFIARNSRPAKHNGTHTTENRQ